MSKFKRFKFIAYIFQAKEKLKRFKDYIFAERKQIERAYKEINVLQKIEKHGYFHMKNNMQCESKTLEQNFKK